MTALHELGLAKYVRFTTYRKSGEAVHSAVWIAPLGDSQLCFTTGGDSGKVKRLHHTARVTLQACDVRGRVLEGSAPVEATARVVDGDDYRPVAAAIRHKYGWQFVLIDIGGRFNSLVRRSRVADAGVIVSPA